VFLLIQEHTSYFLRENKMIDLILAYRPNGCLVGIVPQYDYVNSVKQTDDLEGDELDRRRAVQCFGTLVAPAQGQLDIRPLIMAVAFGVPKQTANDCVELINQIGGSTTGFNVADTLKAYSNFDPKREPMKFSLEDKPELPPDVWHIENGKRICPCCSEEDCGWMGKNSKAV